MAFNPQRSWAVTYNQMWNLSMRDPIPKTTQRSSGFGGQNNTFASKGGHGNGYVSSNNTSNHSKSDYCWNFNKGVPCKFGAQCKFIERCKYCDSPSHGVNACNKLQKKNDGQGNSNTNNSNNNNKSDKN